MSDDSARFIIGVIMIALIAWISCLIWHGGSESGKETGRRESERAAVEAGYAEYYLNEKHERAWRWKESK